MWSGTAPSASEGAGGGGAAQPAVEETGVIIVGSGFSGLCMAARLVQDGRRDFLILEKGTSVGGTWRDNRYPGCACDIPSHLYSLSFGPKPDWSRHYPTQPEIRAYLEEVSRYFALDRQLRFDTALEKAAWEEASARWIVTATDGRRFAAPVLVSAVGALHLPEIPHIAGIEGFAGQAFHSAQWPDHYDPTGHDVAVVGTGASAVQLVPELAKTARRVTVFQRTPPWVMPKYDKAITPRQQWMLRHVPFARRAMRWSIYWAHEARLFLFVGKRKQAEMVRGYGRKVIKRGIPDDRELRRKVTPQYEVGCKRTLISNDYYPALARPNVDVVTDGIDHAVADGIVTKTGETVKVDTIVYGTGFKVVDALKVMDVTGRNGIALQDAWKDGPSAYLGLSVPDFPNFFLMLGPNTGLGHNSQVFMIEAQAEHILRVLKRMRRRKADVVEVDRDRHAAFDTDTQARLANSVWTQGGCRSWYQDAAGRVVALWPRATFTYRRLARRVRRGDYRMEKAGA